MKLKTKYFIRWKGLKYVKRAVIAIIVILLVIFLFKHKGSISDIKVNPNYIGIIGVLCGSLVTGIITYLNTSKAHSRDIKKKEMEYRKKEIYVPLYEDTLKLCNYLRDNAFPDNITTYVYKDERPNSFSEWEKIKKDSRYLSVSLSLRSELDQFVKRIEDYLNFKSTFTQRVDEVRHELVEDHFNNGLTLHTFYKFNEAKHLLINKERFINDICRESLRKKGVDGWPKEKIPVEIAEKIYEEAIIDKNVQEFEKLYKDLVDNAANLLELFQFTINEINKNIYGKIQY